MRNCLRVITIALVVSVGVLLPEAYAQDISGKFVCCMKAVRTQSEASATVGSFSSQGLQCSSLWIPDYDGLSGKELFLVYGGPFDDKVAANAFLKEATRVLGNQGFYIKNVGMKVGRTKSVTDGDRSYASADAELNRVYKSVMADLAPAQQDELRRAQRQWIPYRDSSCARELAAYRGSSNYSSLLATCKADRTRARTREIVAYAEQESGMTSRTSAQQDVAPSTSTPVSNQPIPVDVAPKPTPQPVKTAPKPLKKSLYFKLDEKTGGKRP